MLLVLFFGVLVHMQCMHKTATDDYLLPHAVADKSGQLSLPMVQEQPHSTHAGAAAAAAAAAAEIGRAHRLNSSHL